MDKKRINLLTPDLIVELKLSRKKRISFSPYLAALIIVVLSGSVCLKQKTEIARLNKKIKGRQAELVQIEHKMNEVENERKKVLAKAEQIDKQNENTRKKLRFLRNRIKRWPAWSEVLIELNKCVPDKIWLEGLDLKEETITVKGASLNNPLVSELMQRLSNSSYFSDARFTFTKKDERGEKSVIVFEIASDLAKAH